MKRKNLALLAVGLGLVLGSFSYGATPEKGRSDAELKLTETQDERLEWWRDAKFGMFIHWGLYAQAAGFWNGERPPQGEDQRGEWIMQAVRPSVAEYAALAKTFNPVEFDADEWISMAKYAGVKYIVFTAKHHEGFAMYDSEVSPFNICDATPFKRDVLRELADACHKYDIKLGIYYSQTQDWHHPGGIVYKSGSWDPAQNGELDDYLASIAIPQIKELMSNYGPVAELWWDTPGHYMTRERVSEIVELVGELQPDIIMNNRLGGGFEGDISTPEGHVPATGYPNRDWESCIPMANTWGYRKDITDYTPSRSLLIKLIDVASKGGNLLLNVSPMDTGEIPAGQVERMRDIGRWMQVNSESIYGTKPTIFGAESGTYDITQRDRQGNAKFIPGDDWRCTTKDDRIYIHLLKWPNGSFILNDVSGRVEKAYLLADPKRAPLNVQQKNGTVSIELPDQAPDPVISVLVLDLDAPIVYSKIDPLAQCADGSITLEAANAEVLNGGVAIPTLVLQGKRTGSWSRPEDYLKWNSTLKAPGEFAVFIRYAREPRQPNSTFILNVGGKELRGELPLVKPGGKYKATQVGTLTLDHPGALSVTLKAGESSGEFATLESVMLVPVQ